MVSSVIFIIWMVVGWLMVVVAVPALSGFPLVSLLSGWLEDS